MKALAAQSLSGVPTDTERGFIDAEYQQLIAEIDDMATTTRFNGASLLDGSTAAMPAADYFVGTDVNDVINVDFGTLSGIASYTSTALGLTATGAADVAPVTAAQGAMAAVDTAIEHISEARAPGNGRTAGREN